MSRAYTEEEVRDQFMQQVAATAVYWATLKPNPNSPFPENRRELTAVERCNGLAFSIMSLIDGCTMSLPGINLSVQPHEDDKEFCQKIGENWFEPGMVFNANDALHEIWSNYERSE